VSDGLPIAINPPGLAPPRGYSHGMLAPAGGRALYVAGQVAWDGEGHLVGESFAEQFGQALANVVEVVRAAGGEPRHLVRLTLYVVDRREYLDGLTAVGEAYRGLLGKHYPAMALVEVAALLEPGAKIEIEGTAVLPVASAPQTAE